MMTRDRIERALHEAERLFDAHLLDGTDDADLAAAELVLAVLREMLEDKQ